MLESAMAIGAREPDDALALHARDLHTEAIVIDGVCPWMDDPVHWGDWIRGGANVAVPTVAGCDDGGRALEALASWLRWLRENPSCLLHVERASDVIRAMTEHKLGIVFHFQNSTALNRNNLSLLDAFHRLGVRMIQLCYNHKNYVGDGCLEPVDGGLSMFGKALIPEMNSLGILIDVAHTGERTSLQAAELSERPVVISHSNSRALYDNPRNASDQLIKAVAATGGLIGVCAFPPMVGAGETTLNDVLAHLDYLVDRAGVDHVGLGLDLYRSVTQPEYADRVATFMWTAASYPAPPHVYPRGIEDASLLQNVTLGLLRRGYSDDDVRKIIGGNWLRVYQEVWQ